MKIAATTVLLLSCATVVTSFPMCTNGAAPLMESNDAFPCSKGCPLGFNCEYQDSYLNPGKGICCADAAMLNTIYGDENSMHTDPIWDRNTEISSTAKPLESPTLETPAQHENTATVTQESNNSEADAGQTPVAASELQDKSKGDSEEIVSKRMDTQIVNQTVIVIGSEEEVKGDETAALATQNPGTATMEPEEARSSSEAPTVENTTQHNTETTVILLDMGSSSEPLGDSETSTIQPSESESPGQNNTETFEPVSSTTKPEFIAVDPTDPSSTAEVPVPAEPSTLQPAVLVPEIQPSEKSIILEKPEESGYESPVIDPITSKTLEVSKVEPEQGASAVFVDTHTENTAENNATVTPTEVTTVETAGAIVSDIESPMEGEVGIFGRLPIPRDSLVLEKREYSCERQNYSATCQDGSLNTQPTIRWAWSQLTNSCEFYQFGYCPGDRIVESMTIRSREECASRCSKKYQDKKGSDVTQILEADDTVKKESEASVVPVETATEFSTEISDGFGEIAHPEEPQKFTETPKTSIEDLQDQYEMGANQKEPNTTTETATVAEEAKTEETTTTANELTLVDRVTVAEETTPTINTGEEGNSQHENEEKKITVIEDITIEENGPEANNSNKSEKSVTVTEGSETAPEPTEVEETKAEEATVADENSRNTTAGAVPEMAEGKEDTVTKSPEAKEESTVVILNTLDTEVGKKPCDQKETEHKILDDKVTVTQIETKEETLKPQGKEATPETSENAQKSPEIESEVQKVNENAAGSEVNAEFEDTTHSEKTEASGDKKTDTEASNRMGEIEVVEDGSKLMIATEESGSLLKAEGDDESSEEENKVTEKKLRAELMCSATNYRILCLSGMPTQFVYRWQLIEGECHSFAYGYCFGEFNHGHPRTKLECQQYCIDGKALL